MAAKKKNDSELFFWIQSGQEKKGGKGIHGIHKAKKTVRPRKSSDKDASTDSARVGLKEGWTRASFIVREESLKKIKALAYWERKDIKEIMDEALALYLRGKKIPPIKSKK